MFPFRSLMLVALLCRGIAVPQQQTVVFNRITTNEGPSRGTIYSILQDKQGFLWLGTSTGLLRYDGHVFKRYSHNPSDSTSLSGDFIWSIAEDSSGDLWIGTSGRGLNKYVRATNSFVRYASIPGDSTSLLGSEVVWVYVDRRNDVWAASWNAGLSKFNRKNGTFTRYTTDDGLPGGNVHRMHEDAAGRFWVGTRRGLALFDRASGKSRVYQHDRNNDRTLPDDYIYAISEMHDGSVWFGTGNGVCIYDPSMDDFARVRIPDLKGTASALCEDDSGNIWIATDGDGLLCINPASGGQARYVTDAQNPDAISSNSILSLHRDRSGILWIGTAANGLSKLDAHARKFRHFPMNAAAVNAFHEDARGTVWIATQNGMKRLIGERLHDAKLPEQLENGPFYSVCEDREGNIWFAHTESGLYSLDTRGRLMSFGIPPSPQDATKKFITSLFVDSQGFLWVGQSGGGASRYNIKKNTYVHHSIGTEPQLPAYYVWAIHEDRRGYFWFGTWGVGVIRFDPRTKESVVFNRSHPRANGKGVSGAVVVSIAEEPNGTMWFGTWGEGLNRYDPAGDSITHYSTSNGLPNNHIYGILLDDKTGELWLTTGYGLARFNPKDGSCMAYDEGDGIQSLEFRRGAAHKGRSGVFYVGGVNGCNVFRPGDVPHNTYVPPIALTNVRILDRETSLPQHARLSHNEDFVAFEFASLDFIEPRKNLYAYKLEGLEEDWVDAGTRRYVSYANLSPGNYVFRVKGSNSDGVWNKVGTSFAFTIAPPPWQTWWAYCIYGAVLVMGGLSFRRYEINKIKNRERQVAAIREAELRAEIDKQKTRVQIARDLHDEVGSTLSSISFFAQAMEKEGQEKEKAGKFLSLISESSASAREAMSDIIWSIDPANDSWATLASKLQRYASELFESRGIAHNIEMPSSDLGVHVDPQRRRHFWLLFKEIVTNVARHSQCAEVRICLDVKDGSVVLIVSDNGRGFDPGTAQNGHGLKNIQSRAEFLGASVELKTSPKNGTSWKVSFSI